MAAICSAACCHADADGTDAVTEPNFDLEALGVVGAFGGGKFVARSHVEDFLAPLLQAALGIAVEVLGDDGLRRTLQKWNDEGASDLNALIEIQRAN